MQISFKCIKADKPFDYQNELLLPVDLSLISV